MSVCGQRAVEKGEDTGPSPENEPRDTGGVPIARLVRESMRKVNAKGSGCFFLAGQSLGSFGCLCVEFCRMGLPVRKVAPKGGWVTKCWCPEMPRNPSVAFLHLPVSKHTHESKLPTQQGSVKVAI